MYSTTNKPTVGSTVYHVAHPTIPARVLKILPLCDYGLHTVFVQFDQSVAFSGNPGRGRSEFWVCNPELLYDSEAEAFKHNKENV